MKLKGDQVSEISIVNRLNDKLMQVGTGGPKISYFVLHLDVSSNKTPRHKILTMNFPSEQTNWAQLKRRIKNTSVALMLTMAELTS